MEQKEAIRILESRGCILVSEDYHSDIRAYQRAKDVLPSHRKKLELLNSKTNTKVGNFDVEISASPIFWDKKNNGRVQISVSRDGKYVTSDWLNIDEFRDYMARKLKDKILTSLKYQLQQDLQSASTKDSADLSKKLRYYSDAVDEVIDSTVDTFEDSFEDIKKKIHRYTVYYKSLSNRERNKENLRRKAESNYRKEVPIKVGDSVYGIGRATECRPGKDYIVTKIDGDTAWLAPENGRGKNLKEKIYSLAKNIDDTFFDDPKNAEPEFNQAQYQFDRYNTDQEDFEE